MKTETWGDKEVKWDMRFMRVAKMISSWSKDPSSKIGCVLTRNRQIVATGYNGFPSDIKDTEERWNDRKQKYPLVIHAEMNAILQAGERAEGSTLYLYGMPGPPCSGCTKHVIQADIIRIVTRAGECDRPHWVEDFEIALSMIREAEVWYTTVDI